MSVDPKYRDTILQLIFDSIDEVNEQLPAPLRIAKAIDAPLTIGGGGLDSLAYVNLIAALEEKCENLFGVFVSLSEGATPSGFDTVGGLADVIESKLHGKNDV